MKLKGFTLAELMITLAIVGIIGTLTIPVVVQSITEHNQRVALKKGIQTLNEIISLNIAKGRGDLYSYIDKNADATIASYLMQDNNIDTATNLRNFKPDDNSSDYYFETKDGVRFIIKKSIQEAAGNNRRCGRGNLLGLGGNAALRATNPCVIVIDTAKEEFTNSISNQNVTPNANGQVEYSTRGRYAVQLTDSFVFVPDNVRRFLGEIE